MPRDSLHDYRPDPELPPIISHLAPFSGTDETELENFIPDSAQKAYGYLTGFNEWFLYGHADKKSKKIHMPVKYASEEETAAWNALTSVEKVGRINELPLKEVLTNLKEKLTEEDFGKPLDAKGKPQKGPVNGTQPQYELRPWLWRLLEFAGFVWKGHGGVIDLLLKGDEVKNALELSDDDAKKAGNCLMVGMLNLRMTYMWEMILWLKNGGPDPDSPDNPKLEFNAKAVGSADKTSDIDITLGGKDDVPAMFEVNRYCRSVGARRELGTSFDTMFYVRDWMTVADNINADNATKTLEDDGAPDPSLQVEVLEQVGDLYGLVKIRRFLAKEQWECLTKAMKAEVAVDGFDRVEDIPMFARLQFVERIYQEQYVKPMVSRVRTTDGLKRIMQHKLLVIEDDEDLLEALWHFYPDETLRAANLAYVELAGKVRDDEVEIFRTEAYQAASGEEFVWRQNKGSELVDKPAKRKLTDDGEEVGLNLHGMMAFLERQSLLVSEMALMATEAYFTQGSLWQVVGGQGGARPDNLTLEHYLQCFNEQIGDAMKELQEHRREARLAAMEHDENRNKWRDQQELITAWRNHDEKTERLIKSRQATDDRIALRIRREARTKEFLVGSYRASKYEERMYEVIWWMYHLLEPTTGDKRMPPHKSDEADKVDSKGDPSVEKRKEVYKKLFPGKKTPDELDIDALKVELALAAAYDEHIGKLLAIRKLKKGKNAAGEDVEWASKTEAERSAGAKEIITKSLKEKKVKLPPDNAEKPLPDVMKDERRAPSVPQYRANSPWKPTESDTGDVGMGMLTLMNHMLTHCAIVNKRMRLIFSRGPYDLYVRNFAAEEAEAAPAQGD